MEAAVLQPGLDGAGQQGSEDDGKHRVEDSGGDLEQNGSQRGTGGQAAQQQTVIGKALEEVEYGVGDGGGNGADLVAGVAFALFSNGLSSRR